MLEITRFETAGDAGGELLESGLDQPAPSSPLSLRIAGWALGPGGPPKRVRVFGIEDLGDEPPLRRILVATDPNAQRPEVAARWPQVHGAAASGFSTACSLLGLPLEFALRVEAGFGGSAPVTIAHVEGRRRALGTGHRPRFEPILLRTLGRAGSTWVTHLLAAHPQALAYRPFDFEPRMLDYWMEILRTLSHPHSYAQAIDPDVDDVRAWWEGRTRSLGPLQLDPGDRVGAWLETDSIDELAAFAQLRIDSFYARVAESQDKAGAGRFVERAHEWHEMVLARELYPGAAAVFLVRDPRDLLASRLAFNSKTGLSQFGYGGSASDEDYVRGAMRSELDDLLQSWRAQHADALLLRYEDLMQRPEQTLRALFEHTGLAAGAETVADVLERARATAPQRQSAHRTTADEAASVGRWRRDLAPALQEACADAFAAPLRAFGYDAT